MVGAGVLRVTERLDRGHARGSRAGSTDAITVTTTPMIRETTIVRGCSWSEVLGRSMPNPDSNAFKSDRDPDPGDDADDGRHQSEHEGPR